MNDNYNEEYLEKCAEVLAAYLECDKEEITYTEDYDEVIQSVYEYKDEAYKIAATEDIVDYINNELIPDKVYEIEQELKSRGLFDYIEGIDTYGISEEIYNDLETYFYCPSSRIGFEYERKEYTIFPL